ncbi:MAG: hypothetical protein WCR27_10325 [Eubacteriales bacterium]
MKSLIRKNTYKAIYRLLDKVSPLDVDCGKLCGAICCTTEGDETNLDYSDFELGIYLLPGEDKIFTKKEHWLNWNYEMAEDYEFPDSWSGKVYFIRCKTPPYCDRNMRPLQCRIYPLAPHITCDNNLILILSTANIPYICPLIEKKMELNKDFIKATYTVCKRLIKDPLIFDLIKMDSTKRINFQSVYPK